MRREGSQVVLRKLGVEHGVGLLEDLVLGAAAEDLIGPPPTPVDLDRRQLLLRPAPRFLSSVETRGRRGGVASGSQWRM